MRRRLVVPSARPHVCVGGVELPGYEAGGWARNHPTRAVP